jgi:hypothetical protein
VLTATLLATVLGFTALSVDIGLVRVARTQLQTAVDAAAVSGAQELDGTVAGITSARARAIEFGAYNNVLTHKVTLTTSEVDVGAYNSTTKAFKSYKAGDDVTLVNAVRITKSGSDVVPMLGKFLFGTDALSVKATSLAQRPTNDGALGNTACFLPFAVPDCALAGVAAGSNPPPMVFQMSPTPKDKIAWGNPTNNPNANDSRDQLMGQCDAGQIDEGDPFYVNEGQADSALKQVADILNNKTTAPVKPWDTTLGALPARNGTTANSPSVSSIASKNYGTTLQGLIALVDGGTNCKTVSFTGTKTITGLAWGVVYDVANAGNTKNVWIQLDTKNIHQAWGDSSPTAKGTSVQGTGDASLGGI